MKAWVQPYLGVPFVEKGRSRQGADCYGLVCVIYKEQLGIELPHYTEDYATTNDVQEIKALLEGEIGSQWNEIPLAEIKPYDGLIFRILGQPIHFGLVLDEYYFIHTLKRDGVPGRAWVERYDSIHWRNRLVAAVRWHGA